MDWVPCVDGRGAREAGMESRRGGSEGVFGGGGRLMSTWWVWEGERFEWWLVGQRQKKNHVMWLLIKLVEILAGGQVAQARG